MISSPDNPALKEVRKLRSSSARAKTGRFIAEGEDLIEAAENHGWTAVRRLVAAGTALAGEEVEPALLASVSALGSGTRAIAIFEKRFSEIPDTGVIVHLEGLSDPGNVGSCIRSAHAFGAAGVSIGPETADPFGPKAVRASMGSLFAVPIAECGDPLSIPGSHVALVAHGGKAELDDLPDRPVLMVGSEREGLDMALADAAGFRWTIPLAEGAESLNAAAACAVALFAVNRISGR